MNRIITFFIITFLAINISSVSHGQENKIAYVSDILILTVRTGPARSYEVFQTIESDEKLLILEEQNGFSKVKLNNNAIGWVQSQYLSFETPDPIIISRLNRELDKLKAKNKKQLKTIDSFKQTISQKELEFQGQKKDLESLLSKTTSEKNDYITKYSTIDKKHNELLTKSKQVVMISTENEKLKKTNKELDEKLKLLDSKNKNLLKVGMIKWFLAGAGVIFLGWIIGRTVSSRKSRYSSLLS
jgi:SH3 domain protein